MRLVKNMSNVTDALEYLCFVVDFMSESFTASRELPFSDAAQTGAAMIFNAMRHDLMEIRAELLRQESP